METVNQEDKATAAQPEGKTFTQAELDNIVRERLKREREKYAGFDLYKKKAEEFDALQETQKTELQKATERADALQARLDALNKAEQVRGIRADVAKKAGVPESLLTADTKEGCEEQAQAILAFARPTAYPSVPDAGEAQHFGGGGKPRDKFADWMKQMTGG